MTTGDKLPLTEMDNLAEDEKGKRDAYRPVYSIHKWWAPRPGTTFRVLGLAALTDDTVTSKDILHKNSSGNYEGLYLQHQDDKFEGKSVLDPFAGGGTTPAEINRLGADVLAYELNPVAWWINKKIMDEIDIPEFQSAAENVLEDVRGKVSELYKTTDPDTGEDAEILYSFQTQILPCLTCGEETRLFKNYTFSRNRKTSPAVLFCPNSKCEERIIELNQEISDTVTCQSCGENFDPSDGNAVSPGGNVKYTCSNGHKHDVQETLKRLDEKPEFEYYAIQYITKSGDKKFKEPDEDDQEAIQKASELLSEKFEELPIPTQKIPSGDKTSRLTARNYEHFHEVFSDRHLLTYGHLFEKAWEYDNQNIAEYLVTAISYSLNRASTLVKWDHYYSIGGDVFPRKSYIPRVQPVEGNPINTAQNIVAVENFFEKVKRAKEYCNRPFEKLRENGELETHYIQNESIDPDRVKTLQCKTSEGMELDDASVDYIITDPPYYDNIQYSELSEYFYVWLHHVLRDEYEEFSAPHVASAREIVQNPRAGKDAEFFIDSLTNVFSECNRVLKDAGELIFTYHHNENEAWSVILQSIVESGFTITGAYPVQSEVPNSVTIRDLENAEYDIIIFADKQSSDDEITLPELRKNLYFEMQDMIERERERHQNLNRADLSVILRGKSLHYYSKHYPNVHSEGEVVGVEKVLDMTNEIIEHILEGTVNLPQGIDSITQAYAAFCQRGHEEYDDLNKHLLSKNLNVSDLEDERLVKGPRDKKQPVMADERITHIRTKLNDNGNGEDRLLDIDRVHYLYHLYKSDQNTVEYLKKWKTQDLERLAEFMADVTGDDRYHDVMEMSLQQF